MPKPPKALGEIEPSHIRPETLSLIQVKYTDQNKDKALSCSITDLEEEYFTIQKACQCDNEGVCTFEVTGKGKDRSSTFSYSVRDADGDSEKVTTRISIDQTPPEMPTDFALAPSLKPTFNERRPKIIVRSLSAVIRRFFFKMMKLVVISKSLVRVSLV